MISAPEESNTPNQTFGQGHSLRGPDVVILIQAADPALAVYSGFRLVLAAHEDSQAPDTYDDPGRRGAIFFPSGHAVQHRKQAQWRSGVVSDHAAHSVTASS